MIKGSSKEIKKEATVPVQSRIDIRTLAEICQYLMSAEAKINTVSRLVSWSLEVLVETLRRNKKIELNRPSIEASYQYLENIGLMQRGMKNKKITLARGFEELRMEGVDPSIYSQRDYKSIHNNPKWIGEAPRIDINAEDHESKHEDRYDLDEAFKRADEERVKEMKKQREKEIERFKANCVVDENGVYSYRGTHSGIVGIKEKEAYNKDEKAREENIEIDKEVKRLERRKEKSLNKVDDIRERKKLATVNQPDLQETNDIVIKGGKDE